jgi:hypothetical protein
MEFGSIGGPPNTVSLGAAGRDRKNGSGQDARATVARASCPEPSPAKPRANRTVIGVPPAVSGILPDTLQQIHRDGPTKLHPMPPLSNNTSLVP